MINSDHLRRLHFINALFAGLTGNDLYLAQQIQSAITTSLTEAENRPPGDPAFSAAAARLLARLCDGRQDYGFFHWDAAESAAAATPLFTRENVLAGLKRLARYRESTLLVTNLRPAHCPPRRRWTGRRQREYRESLALIRDLAAARSRRSASLNLLFL
ncbi:MAG: hypothetical protein PHE83_08795 [Opitutaceae bacterium]|nr:hypothetical protein [Opitutaceae bacterium]